MLRWMYCFALAMVLTGLSGLGLLDGHTLRAATALVKSTTPGGSFRSTIARSDCGTRPPRGRALRRPSPARPDLSTRANNTEFGCSVVTVVFAHVAAPSS